LSLVTTSLLNTVLMYSSHKQGAGGRESVSRQEPMGTLFFVSKLEQYGMPTTPTRRRFGAVSTLKRRW
jgi:hypothetical protein